MRSRTYSRNLELNNMLLVTSLALVVKINAMLIGVGVVIASPCYSKWWNLTHIWNGNLQMVNPKTGHRPIFWFIADWTSLKLDVVSCGLCQILAYSLFLSLSAASSFTTLNSLIAYSLRQTLTDSLRLKNWKSSYTSELPKVWLGPYIDTAIFSYSYSRLWSIST